MAFRHLLFLILLSVFISTTFSSPSLIRLPTGHRKFGFNDDLYCDSWRLSVETNNAGGWSTIPSQCQVFVQNYMTGERYLSDSVIVANYSLAYASSVEIATDGKDAWVFDIDETLLSNLPYYERHGFGSETFDEESFDEWVDLADARALPASLKLYNQVKEMGFKIFLLTGRSEDQRNVTTKDLLFAGYSDWERLILRESSDEGKLAIVYKSEKRSELVNEGYRIRGNSGDQWSDLLGFAVAERSFKLPNPMYFIA
ncbi:hypothetical protein SLA2020_230220 [Shorea laevis]